MRGLVDPDIENSLHLMVSKTRHALLNLPVDKVFQPNPMII